MRQRKITNWRRNFCRHHWRCCRRRRRRCLFRVRFSCSRWTWTSPNQMTTSTREVIYTGLLFSKGIPIVPFADRMPLTERWNLPICSLLTFRVRHASTLFTNEMDAIYFRSRATNWLCVCVWAQCVNGLLNGPRKGRSRRKLLGIINYTFRLQYKGDPHMPEWPDMKQMNGIAVNWPPFEHVFEQPETRDALHCAIEMIHLLVERNCSKLFFRSSPSTGLIRTSTAICWIPATFCCFNCWNQLDIVASRWNLIYFRKTKEQNAQEPRFTVHTPCDTFITFNSAIPLYSMHFERSCKCIAIVSSPSLVWCSPERDVPFTVYTLH